MAFSNSFKCQEKNKSLEVHFMYGKIILYNSFYYWKKFTLQVNKSLEIHFMYGKIMMNNIFNYWKKFAIQVMEVLTQQMLFIIVKIIYC
jgi:hypothetical protein